MHDDNDTNDECCEYLYKILGTAHITITKSPGEGVSAGHGQAESAVGQQKLVLV